MNLKISANEDLEDVRDSPLKDNILPPVYSSVTSRRPRVLNESKELTLRETRYGIGLRSVMNLAPLFNRDSSMKSARSDSGPA